MVRYTVGDNEKTYSSLDAARKAAVYQLEHSFKQSITITNITDWRSVHTAGKVHKVKPWDFDETGEYEYYYTPTVYKGDFGRSGKAVRITTGGKRRSW